MSKSEEEINEDCFIKYNSLISLSITSQCYENSTKSKILFVKDNLEHSLFFKSYKKPLIEYNDLICSYFFIRNIEECKENFGFSEKKNKKTYKNVENTSKELVYISKENLNQNSEFYLQHMMSKKFVSVEKTPDNKIRLKLLKNIDNAAIFSLRKINVRRNLKEFLTTKEIYYLMLYFKEEDIFFYLYDNKNPVDEDEKFYDIFVDRNPITQFIIIDQNYNIKDIKNIYSGQLINIVFSYIKEKENKEEKLMLSVEKNINTKKYRIVGKPYSSELYQHILNNSFWTIEQEPDNIGYIDIGPVKIKKRVRLKNVDTGLYLSLRKQNVNNNDSSESWDMNSFILENQNLEFYLVDEEKLNSSSEYNFVFYNYIFDTSSSEIIDEGKYIIKNAFRKNNITSASDLELYYESISLNIKEKNLMIKNEEDFIFQIKKIDIFKGNQANYIVTIINILDNEINGNFLNNYNIINDSIEFFLEYLLNIDYSFRDKNFEYNVPIKKRQILLFKFNIIEIITNLIENIRKKIEDENKILTEEIKKMLEALLSNIIKFFKYLSINNEEIKQSIYIIALNKLLPISEIIFNEDITIIINFIFDLVDDSEALQDYLLGGGGLLKQQIMKNPILSKKDITYLLREKKLLDYIENNYNFLIFYEKLIGLNKVQYKRNEIICHVKNHIEEVKNKKNCSSKSYRQMMNNLIRGIIEIIKKHGVLLDRFKNDDLNQIDNYIKKRRTDYIRKNSIKNNLKRKNDLKTKTRKGRLTKILVNNIFTFDPSKNISTKPLLENNENNENESINNNPIKNLNNKKSINKIFSFSSINSLNNENNRNNIYSNQNFNIETTDSCRPLKEKDENIENIKSEFKSEDVHNNKIQSRKTTKFKSNNIFSNILKKKTKKDPLKTPFEETIRTELNEPYQLYLNKLGKILIFLKFFTCFELDNILFVQDNFLSEIFKSGLKTEDLENPLYIFFIGKSHLGKNKSWYYDPKSIILYLFHLYNMIFPNLKSSKLQNKINNNENVSGKDILEEMDNVGDINDYSDIMNEVEYKIELKKDFETLDDCLCIIYSIYYFCVNQYVKTVYKLFKIISNFYLNFVEINEIKKIKHYFLQSLENLFIKVTFIKNEILENYYLKTTSSIILTKELDIEFISQILNNFSIKKGKRKNKKLFSKTESSFLEYILYLSIKCEDIKYLYEKIVILKYIKNIIDNEWKIGSKEDFDSIIDEQLLNIMKALDNHKMKILEFYENYNKLKENYSLTRNCNSLENNKKEEENLDEGEINDNYEAIQIDKKTEIITKLLRNYEIDKFFKNIIYIESNDIFLNNDKIIKKIRKLREILYRIESEIQLIKINLGKEEENYKEVNNNSFMVLNRYFSQICNESGKLFDLNKIVCKRKDKLSQILSMENNLFYKNIKFFKTFKFMVEALDYFILGENDKNILLYCSYLLKIFIDIQNIDFNFRKKIPNNYELFRTLLLTSLKYIEEYVVEKIDDNVEYFFLNICFYSIEGLLLILNNCKKSFSETKDLMESVFNKYQKIFSQFKEKKYKIIHQTLYTYAVSRVLLFLNKNKTYDRYSYEKFFNYIYPKDQMKKNISFCIQIINNNSNKDHIISRKNTNVFLSESNSESQNDEDSSYFSIPDDEKDLLLMKDLNSRILPMDLSKVLKMKEGKIRKSQEKTAILKEDEIEISDADADYIRWEDEDELSRLSFYLNFLSVYVIYLNDKNCLLKQEEDDYSKNERDEIKEEFSFNNLSNKIKEFLDSNHSYSNNPNEEEVNNNFISSQFSTLIKEEKKYYEEELGPKNMEYKFHSTLLESILCYRASLSGKNLEIQVKKAKRKKYENFNENQKTETQILETSLLKSNNNNSENNKDNIIFYYYDPSYIDIILLEKIFIGIELKEELMSYCLEDYHFERENPQLLNSLLNMKKNYNMIESYTNEEFDLIHNYFIKNNMEKLINIVLKSFNSNDLLKIEGMNNYLFKKMGEIYSDINIKMNNEFLAKSYSLVEYFKYLKDNEEIKKQNIEEEKTDETLNEEKIRDNFSKIDLLTFFNSLVYIYPKFKKSICIIYYKIGFQLLSEKCKEELLTSNSKEQINNESSKKLDLEPITNILLLLLSRETNRELIEDKTVFPTMLNSIRDYFSYIIFNGSEFVFKNGELLKQLFHKLDFIFDHLSKDFEKIVLFMKKPTKINNKFDKKRNRLENLLDFLIIFLEINKLTEENILTEEIDKFSKKVIEKVIKLLFILLEIPNRTNLEIVDILVDFLFNFIKGPSVENLYLLFSLGFFKLVTFVIKDIDYYELFLNFLSKDNMNEIIDGVSEIECKIIKIFIIYYNLSHSDNDKSVLEFEKLQLWYEENFNFIRKKLKRLYYLSQKEMEGREYNINKMLLFIKSNDNYIESELKRREKLYISSNELDSIFEVFSSRNKSKIKEKIIEESSRDKSYCIIKFDLLIAYYSLYNYHKDLTTKDKESLLNFAQNKNKNFYFWMINFFIDFYNFLKNFILIIFYLVYFIFSRIYSKRKKDVDLLQDLTNINFKSQQLDDQKIINFLRLHIRELELSIKNDIYKIYFPMLDKANTIEEYKEEYYKVEKIDSSEFLNHILNNYDSINIRAKQYVLINKIIKLPIINFLFKSIDVFAFLLIIFGIISNLLIMLSFSTFVEEKCGPPNYPNTINEVRIQCPHFLYKKSSNDDYMKKIIAQFGFVELVLQFLIFIDYIVRIFAVEKELIEFKYQIKQLKEGETSYHTITKIITIILRCVINFQSLYYILSLIFIILGLKIHPFFNCLILLEFVNRIQLMQTVLKAMYKPLKNILITLLMFIILEYFFSLFAVSFFTYHFPNPTDTKNFLKTFMRMMDQTFKQDGGIGTYLDKSLDDGYQPYTLSSYFNIRFFFDLLFFLLILLLIFQMFLSTIIDYFNETRENTENFQEGLETHCTVCNMDREKIEKIYSNDKHAFDLHTNNYHNAFNYVYYLMYLQSCSSRDPIIENSIWNLHLKKDLTYLPKNICFKQFEKKMLEKIKLKKNEDEQEEE